MTTQKKIWTRPNLEVILMRSAQALLAGNQSDGVLGRLLHRSL